MNSIVIAILRPVVVCVLVIQSLFYVLCPCVVYNVCIRTLFYSFLDMYYKKDNKYKYRFWLVYIDTNADTDTNRIDFQYTRHP